MKVIYVFLMLFVSLFSSFFSFSQDTISLLESARNNSRLGRAGIAMIQINSYLKENKKSVDALNTRGVIYYSVGNYKQALKDFRKALRIEPTYYEPQANIAYVYSEYLGEIKRAIIEYDKAILLAPENGGIYWNRARAKRFGGLYFDAIEDYTAALKFIPDNPRLYLDRSLAFSGLGWNDKALKDCNDAIELKPLLGMSYAHRGIVYLNKMETEKACIDFKWSVELGYDKAAKELENYCKEYSFPRSDVDHFEK